MGLPLTEVLGKVPGIPLHEFRGRAGEGEKGRPVEMALLAEIIPTSKIWEIRQKPGYWISRCCDLNPPRIKFQVTNGETHIVVVSLVGDKLQITDNREIKNIDTVEGLRRHILELAGVE